MSRELVCADLDREIGKIWIANLFQKTVWTFCQEIVSGSDRQLWIKIKS